jgi:hypothetical protein
MRGPASAEPATSAIARIAFFICLLLSYAICKGMQRAKRYVPDSVANVAIERVLAGGCAPRSW